MRNLDKLKLFVAGLFLVMASSCGDDEILNNTPSPIAPGDSGEPSIAGLTLSPEAVEFGDTVTFSGSFSDGTELGQVDINIIDTRPALLLDTTITLSGTSGDVSFDLIIPFTPYSRSGATVVEVTATDASGNMVMDKSGSFDINRPEISEMYFHLNDDNGAAMTNVGDHQWQLLASVNNGDMFRFATNAVDSLARYVWGDKDEVTDGIAGINQPAALFDGESSFFQIDFNDSTFEFTIEEAVFDEMFLIGNFNGWGNARPEDEMAKVGEHDWLITTDFSNPNGVALGDVEFKFVAGPNFGVTDWGDNGADGIADRFGANIAPGLTDAPVSVSFNDITGVYEFSTTARNYADVYILGSFNGWGNGTEDHHFELISDNTWQLEITFPDDNAEFKFVDGPNFGGTDWGDVGGDGTLEEFGDNIAPGLPAGTYVIYIDDAAETYKFSTPAYDDIYILGAHNGWGNGGPDDRMRVVAENTWELQVDFTDGDQFKFVDANNFGGTDWGDNGADGTADPFGDNIAPGSGTGTYTVTFNDQTLDYTVILN